jgi:hypothetical protein
MSVTSASEISAARIYASGDILIVNPVNACIIFVSSIIVSAVLEYSVRFVQTRVENRYVRTVVDVVTQELTIVGVVALCIMLAQSALPAESSYRIYVTILTLANICLFIMACLFVAFVVAQFLVGMLDFQQWKRFEEGRMDSEEVRSLRFREQRYKLAADRYTSELQRVYGLSLRECPFHEVCGSYYKRLLVRLSNLSFRVWLALSVVVLANFGRAVLSPWSSTDSMTNLQRLLNGGLYLACTGYFIALILILFCLHLRSKLNALLEGKYPVLSTVGADLVLFGDPMLCVELMQCVVMSMNYYGTLFVTGIAETIPSQYRIVAVVLFLVPYAVMWVLCFWAIWALSIMSVLGGLHKNKTMIERAVLRLLGDADVDSELESDPEDFSDDEAIGTVDNKSKTKKPGGAEASTAAAKPRTKMERKKSAGLLTVRSGHQKLAATAESPIAPRPLWLDPDDHWDGATTSAAGAVEPNTIAAADRVFFDNVDSREFQIVLRQQAPHLVHDAEEQRRRAANDEVQDRTCRDGKKRPVWLDSDEELDERIL